MDGQVGRGGGWPDRRVTHEWMGAGDVAGGRTHRTGTGGRVDSAWSGWLVLVEGGPRL